MLSTLIVVVLILAVGGNASDRLRVRQEEVILARLPEAEAIAYYEVLRKRVRKLQVLRAIVLISLVVLSYTYKHRITHGGVTARAATGAAGQ